MYYLFLSVLNLALFPQNFDNSILSPLQLVTFSQHSQLLTALLENISKSIEVFLFLCTTIKANCAMLEYSSSNWVRLSLSLKIFLNVIKKDRLFRVLLFLNLQSFCYDFWNKWNYLVCFFCDKKKKHMDRQTCSWH